MDASAPLPADRSPTLRRAAFFDLEKTIASHAVEQVCALWLFRRGEIALRDLLRTAYIYVKYDLGLISDFETLKRYGARVFKGRRYSRDLQMLEPFFQEHLQRFIYPEALRAIEELRRDQVDVYIISSTYRFLVAPYARLLQATDFFGTELEVVDDICTGRIVNTIFHQENKGRLVEELARQKGYDLAQCYAFGDSLNDRFMLEKVGHARAINPGRKLRALSTEKRWQVLRWEL